MCEIDLNKADYKKKKKHKNKGECTLKNRNKGNRTHRERHRINAIPYIQYMSPAVTGQSGGQPVSAVSANRLKSPPKRKDFKPARRAAAQVI